MGNVGSVQVGDGIGVKKGCQILSEELSELLVPAGLLGVIENYLIELWIGQDSYTLEQY